MAANRNDRLETEQGETRLEAVDLETGKTRTLLGTGLFDWGDGEEALRPKLIQHPLSVAAGSAGLPRSLKSMHWCSASPSTRRATGAHDVFQKLRA